MKEHGELKLMRSGWADGVWWACRERNGLVIERWPLDANSVEQLERMRDALLRESSVGSEQ